MGKVIIMSFDGIFLHHLLEEIKPNINGQRINRVHSLDRNNFIFVLGNRRELYLSLNSDSSYLGFTKRKYIPSSKMFPLLDLMKKHLEGAIISSVSQVENDRILFLDVNSSNELGFIRKLRVVIELFGRNSNLLLLDENKIIIECLKRTYLLEDNNKRTILPKVPYQIPIDSKKVNPYKSNQILEYNNYQGVSNLLYAEIRFQNKLSIINNKTEPVLIKTKTKNYFYCFPLTHLDGKFVTYPSLSELLESFYLELREDNVRNAEQKQIEIYLKKEITKAHTKLQKQVGEKAKAEKNLGLEKIGHLLSANLHLLDKNASYIEVEDFYNDNQKIRIELNPLLSPTQNLEAIYNRYKKAKRTLNHLDKQLAATKNEILYYQVLQEQLQFAGNLELKEIWEELHLNKTTTKTRKPAKPKLTTYQTKDAIIMVGKNNFQNNYLTHKLANRNDYFFHVKDSPGAHTILRTSELTDELIVLAATIAAYYSKSRFSSQVPVNYTLVRNLKKVPGTAGSFVTYSKYQTVYVTPSEEYIYKYASPGRE